MPDTGAALKEKIEKRLSEKFAPDSFTLSEYRGEVTVQVDRDRLRDLATFLRDDAELRFDSMAYMTAVDWLLHNRKPRFDVVYHLYSYTHHHRLRIKSTVPEDDCWSPSLWPVWKSSNFMEREAYDMFGITFREHPDLRRILMPDDWEGWPLRKDFPMGGTKSFYFKRDTEPHVGEPEELVPRIRVQKSDI